jgi:hypothetical protein
MNVKTARALVEELTRYVMPPRGTAIVLKESTLDGADDPNWIATSGIMDLAKQHLLTEKVAELRESDRLIDWSGVTGQINQRRVALWASEVKNRTPRNDLEMAADESHKRVAAV